MSIHKTKANAIIKPNIFALVVFILFLFSSCQKENEENDLFNYSGFDSLGVKIVEGAFSMVYIDSNSIEGDWNFAKIGNPIGIGNQVGSGEYYGFTNNNTISINLNPDYVDDNVNLFGTMNDNTIDGEWSYSTLHGVVNYGTFTAEK